MSDDKVIEFQRRKINEWPKQVYLADFGDGDGCRPYDFIQRPDDTTPLYVRSDLHDALRAENERLRERITDAYIEGHCTAQMDLGYKLAPQSMIREAAEKSYISSVARLTALKTKKGPGG